MTMHDYYAQVAAAPLGTIHHVPSNDTQHSMVYYIGRRFGVAVAPEGPGHVKRICPCCKR